MAKPYADLPGCSGHLHLSLSRNGKNIFYDANDKQLVSEELRHFVAGILLGLPSIMAVLAPNINR
jgi:glutamine synthetase